MKKLTPRTGMGPLSSRSGNLPHFTPPKQIFQLPERVTNASSRETYSQAHEWRGSGLRPNCMDFLRWPSKGMV